MKPKEPVESGQHDMFRSRLDQIIDMGHEKAVLAGAIDWQFLSDKCGENYTDKPGHPPLTTRLMAGIHILKYADNLSDEELCAKWVENPYYQFFCGEEFFCHELPFDRSSMTRWRQRMGEEKLQALLQESLCVAVKLGAARPSDFTRVIVDTTVAEKNVAYPTDAKLCHRAREKLVKLANDHGIKLRQSYKRVGKNALIMQQRYAHAKHYKRAKKQLRKLKTYLGRTIRDIKRQIAGNRVLEDTFLRPLWLAERVMISPRRSIPCTHPRLNASARERPTSHGSLVLRHRLPPPSTAARAASSLFMPRRCREGHMMDIHWQQSFPRSNKSPGRPSNVFWQMQDTGATMHPKATSSVSSPQAKNEG